MSTKHWPIFCLYLWLWVAASLSPMDKLADKQKGNVGQVPREKSRPKEKRNEERRRLLQYIERAKSDVCGVKNMA